MDAALIRQAGPADLRAVCTIARLAPEAAQWSETALESFLAAGGEIRLATSSGAVAGFLAARRAADEIEILNLAVLPEFRRQGLGRQLVQATMLEAQERGAASAHLEVRSSNGAAVAFYGACGFRASGRRENYYHNPVEDALLMGRRLGSP